MILGQAFPPTMPPESVARSGREAHPNVGGGECPRWPVVRRWRRLVVRFLLRVAEDRWMAFCLMAIEERFEDDLEQPGEEREEVEEQ